MDFKYRNHGMLYVFCLTFLFIIFFILPTSIKADTLSATIQNVNQDRGTFDVVVNASASVGVDHVAVPVWRDADQNDIYWYQATKQSDGTYIVHMSIANHKYHRGTYTEHVYMYKQDGTTSVIAAPATRLEFINQITYDVSNVTSTGYDLTVRASAGNNRVTDLTIPTWSQASNQRDLIWYRPIARADGTYFQHVDIKNHKNNQGYYISHIYMTTSNGETYAIPVPEINLSGDILNLVKDATRIDGKYSFIAQWIPGKTTLETFGATWAHTSYGYGGATGLRYFAPSSDAQKGQVGVIYHNVGIYNGKTIDLKVTVLDWKAITNKNGYIEYTEGVIAHLQQKYYYVKQKWEFIDASTGLPVNLNGYMTISDIDSRQGVTFDKTTTSSITGIYVTPDTGVAIKHDSDGNLVAYDGPYRMVEPTDKTGQFTFTFANTSALIFSWTLTERPPEEFPNITPPVLGSEINGEFFSFTGKKIARTTPIPPDKFVRQDGSSMLQTSNSLNSLDDHINYEIFYTVNDESSEFYYNHYEMKDVLPDGLNVISAKIFNLKSEDVTSLFTNHSSGNVIDFQANANLLNSPSFYNNVYTLKIVAQPKPYDQIKNLIVDNKVTFSNKAYLLMDDQPAVESKSVTTEVYINGNAPKGQVIHYDQSVDPTGTSPASIIKSEDIAFQEHKVWVPNLQQVTVRTVRWDSATSSYVWENKTETQDLGHYTYTYSYSVSPRTDLLKNTSTGTYKYIPMTNQVFSQSNIPSNSLDKIQIKIPYLAPQAEVYANKLIVDTDDASTGLPFTLTMVKNVLHYKTSSADFTNVKLNVKIVDLNTGKVYWQTVQPFYQLATTYTGRLNVVGFNNGAKIPLKVIVDVVENPDEREILLDAGIFNSFGYVKSHQNIMGNLPYAQFNTQADNTGEVTYPIRTEKVRGVDVHTYYETLCVSTKSLVRTKTGYGIIPNVTVDYHNDLDQTYDLRLNLKIPKSFVTSEDHLDVITLSDGYQLAMDTSNQLARVYIKQDTGAVYNLKYVDNVSDFIDGDFKLYIPIWHSLGKYPISYTFQAGTVGRNAISLNLQSAIDVYANMYATSKSTSITHDELFVKPSSGN